MNSYQFWDMAYYDCILALKWEADLPKHVTSEYFCNAVMLDCAMMAQSVVTKFKQTHYD